MQQQPLDHETPQPPAERRAGMWISVAIAALLVLVFLPLLTLPLGALAFLGVACARSAIANRQVGWVGGFIFGIVLALAGLAGIAVVLALKLGWKF